MGWAGLGAATGVLRLGLQQRLELELRGTQQEGRMR